MSVELETARVAYSGSGTTGPFSIPFYFLANTHIRAVKLVAGVETTLVLTTHYTLTGAEDQDGGTLTLVSALASGETLTIIRNVPFTQATEWPIADPFPAESHERAADKVVMMVQQINDSVGRNLRQPISDTAVMADLPVASARANMALTFDVDGNPLMADISGTVIAFTPTTEAFNGTGAQVAYTLSGAPSVASALVVRIDGVVQTPITDFTVSGTTLTFTTAPATGTGNIVVQNFGIAAVVDTVGVDNVTGLSASTGASKVGFAQSGIGASARSVEDKERDIVSVFDFMTATQIADARARGGSVDMAADAQEAATSLTTSGGTLWYPGGVFKQTAAVALPQNTNARGGGQGATIINCWGVDGFTVAAGGSNVNVERLSLIGYSALGVIDSKTQKAIAINGASGNKCPSIGIHDVYARGWASASYLSYVQGASIRNLETVTCTYGVDIFGQTTNVSLEGCHLVVTSGTASVRTLKDGATRPEGLMISDSVLYGGTYGLKSDGILSLIANGNVIDNCTDIGVDLTNPAASRVNDNWIYAANYGVYLQALGSAVDVLAQINGNYVEVTAANAKNIRIGTNNQKVQANGNILHSALTGGTERLVFFDGTNSGCQFCHNIMSNSASVNPNGYIGSAGVSIKDNTGNTTFQYSTENFGPVSSDRGNASATLVVGTDPETNVWNTILTADRTVTLSATGVSPGDRFRIVRTAAATGAFNLSAGGLKNLTAGQWCDVRNGTSYGWFLEAFGSL